MSGLTQLKITLRQNVWRSTFDSRCDVRRFRKLDILGCQLFYSTIKAMHKIFIEHLSLEQHPAHTEIRVSKF